MKRIALSLSACLLASAFLAGCSGGSSASQDDAQASSSLSDTQLVQQSVESSNAQVGDTQGQQNAAAAASSSLPEDLQDLVVDVSEQPAVGSSEVGSSAQDSPELKSRISAVVSPIVEASGMQIGVTVIDLATGERASIGGEQQMYAASMIKLVIAAAFMDRVEAGTYSLDGTYTLQADDIVGGTGSLSGMGAGASVTYRELVERMIYESDNTSANILIDAVGMDAVNAKAASLGMLSTQLNRRMMDEAAVAAGIENYTSADDVAKILDMIYRGTLVSSDASAVILHALEMQQDSQGIAAGLPEVVFAHKTGTLSTVRHDGGIVEGDHPFVLSITCGGEGFYEGGANTAMAEIGAAVYSELANS